MLVTARAQALEAERVQKRIEEEEILREKVRKQREEMAARRKEEEEEEARRVRTDFLERCIVCTCNCLPLFRLLCLSLLNW